jgi:hypothetical protein
VDPESSGYNVTFCEVEGKSSLTWRQATYEIEFLKKDGVVNKGFHLSIYFCRNCGYFHIGNQANRLRRRNKGRYIKRDNQEDELD